MATTDHDATTDTKRRDVLRALSVGTGLTASASAATSARATATEKTLTIQHVCEGHVEYNVCVSDRITKAKDADLSDQITHGGQCAEGTMGPTRGRDTFQFTGTVESFDIEGPAVVQAESERLFTPECYKQTPRSDADDSGGQDRFCPLDNQLHIWTTKRVEFEVAVSGQLELPSGRRIEERTGIVEPDDGVPRARLSLPYSGEITHLQLRGDGKVTFEQPAPCN